MLFFKEWYKHQEGAILCNAKVLVGKQICHGLQTTQLLEKEPMV